MREDWESRGATDLYTRCHAKAKDILAEHRPEPLPDDVAQRIRAIVEETDRAAGVTPASPEGEPDEGTTQAGDHRRQRRDGDRPDQRPAGHRLGPEILDEALLPGMEVVGTRMRDGDCFIPEVLLSARVMQSCLDLLRPHMAAGGEPVGRVVVIGTVKGDLHDIGKNLVGIMFEGGGFEVIDLGVDVPPEKFVAAVKDKQPNMVAMSALLTTTMPPDEEHHRRRSAGRRPRQGQGHRRRGALTQQYADEIGADGYSDNAGMAVERAKELAG